MADESMQMPDKGASDLLQPETEIPCRLDSLEADGIRPEVGDEVTVKIVGTVKSIKDDCAYILPEQINDTDLEEILAEQGNQDEDALIKRLTTEADIGGMPLGGGGY
jgi:hypothetical protein